MGELAKALTTSWNYLNESKLFQYAVKIGNATVVKRLGFLMETLTIGHPDELRAMGADPQSENNGQRTERHN